MLNLAPIVLSGKVAKLEPLAATHLDGLRDAATDGQLWELWYTSVPGPDAMAADVARRLAHEIKNPLTPIQLSAERLQMKLSDKLSPSDADVLKRGATTIVNQVQAMKTLVNEFRDYARLPAAHLVSIDFNALVTEVLGLYGSAQESGRLRAELANRVDGHRGLSNMATRAMELGGSFALRRARLGGVRVEVVLPLPRVPGRSNDEC